MVQVLEHAFERGATYVTSRTILALGLAAVLAVGACSTPSATPSPAASQPPASTPESTAPESTAPESTAPESPRRSSPTRPRPSSRTSSRATIAFWTYYLSPTFDKYIQDTIARFRRPTRA
jgi:hypothetical protein